MPVPGEVAEFLFRELTRAGYDRVLYAAEKRVAVVSITSDRTVWIFADRVLWLDAGVVHGWRIGEAGALLPKVIAATHASSPTEHVSSSTSPAAERDASAERAAVALAARLRELAPSTSTDTDIHTPAVLHAWAGPHRPVTVTVTDTEYLWPGNDGVQHHCARNAPDTAAEEITHLLTKKESK